MPLKQSLVSFALYSINLKYISSFSACSLTLKVGALERVVDKKKTKGIKLNNKRNAELCTCARKFFKCKCGKWFPESRYIIDFQCDNCDRTLVKCPPSCGRAQSLNKGEITQCLKCKTTYRDDGARMSTESV